MNTKTCSIFADHEVSNTVNSLHNQSVVVPADKAASNVVFTYKS